MSPTAGDPARGPEVQAMFDRIAPTYDLANRVLSMGIDTIWRRKALAAIAPVAEGPALDLCAGTLDLTLELLEHGAPSVDALDFSAEMLAHGRPRLPEGAPVRTLQGDAQDLELPDNTYATGLCGFGLRNVPDNRKALSEVFRVLRPGGRFAVLEFFRPVRSDAKAFHAVFNNVVLPTVGGLISGDRAAYSYLADSMVTYLTRADFEATALDVGFELVSGAELLPPVASLVVLKKPVEATS
ncbi:MAG: ubiquinone/menaquinone biosynthesis methyltransferase [Proteobacteria bacterium]|nr:ubiquinone/menaquinone biosynthesis methyltransferase [Pseudomonadota bacterium]MCP4915399.1 ubiquinone/menaquinone biosynthesis methyltransferase [Pseudomonadota bacterium]